MSGDTPQDGAWGRWAVVEAVDRPGRWDFMYFIEAMDNGGNGAIYLGLKKETPYVVVKLDRGGAG